MAAGASSASGLGLNTVATFTTLSSTEEVNATPTSFSPFGPTLIGSSTSDATVTGNKQGNPNDVLTFEVSDAGTVGGSVDLKLKVFDQNDNQVDEVFIAAGTPPDTVISLSNGLDVSFSAGELALGDEFDVTFAPGGAPTATPWLIPDPTVGGTYTGSVDDVLTFEVSNGGYVGGSVELKLKVLDGQQNQIDEVIFAPGTPADTPFALSNGLEISLSSGKLIQGRTFQVNVYSSVPSAVDPNKPFDGTRNNNPNFESGTTVTAGSFDVNGVTINVGASDTLNDVLASINASSAGVTAIFDAATETVLLTQETAGSANQIVFSSDPTGFLAATKLSGASQVLGQDDEPGVPIDQVALSGITSGNLQINGVSISIDTSTDSLNDVIAAINGSAANVTASFNSTTNLVTITSNDASADLVLADSTSGFFTGVEIMPGTFEPTEGVATPGGEALKQPSAFESQFENLGKELDSIFRESFEGVDEELLPAIEDVLSGAISDSFAKILGETGQSKLRSSFGIDFDFRDAERGVSAFDTRSLSRSLERELEQITDFLFRERSSGEKDGLVVSLIEAVKELESTFEDALRSGTGETSGILVDLSV